MELANETSLRTVGHVDNKVYYYIGNKQYSRAYVIPVQPGTGAQRAWWEWFKHYHFLWQGLSQGEKDALDVRARPFHFSGFNLYMRECLEPHGGP